jgi:hypothetical protein
MSSTPPAQATPVVVDNALATTAKPYQKTPLEQAATDRLVQRREKRTPSPRFKKGKLVGNVNTVDFDHPDTTTGFTLLADLFATSCDKFSSGLFAQLNNLGDSATLSDTNFALATVKAINPRDETETLLAVQMAAIHNATMKTASILKSTSTTTQQDSAANALNKLARTFAVQMDTLKRYRSTSEQTIRVQHVTVQEGGQAVVTGELHTRPAPK